MRRVYLDHNATTPLHPAVLEEMVPYLREAFGNPSSIHWHGQEARRAVDRARQQTADLIGAEPDEIVFVSGGTEACNHAIRGAVAGAEGYGRHVVTSPIEHQAVLSACAFLEGKACRVTYLPVGGDGLVDSESVEKAIGPDTVLVSLMLANNEVGTLQPVRDIARIARARGVPVYTDAVQAAGKIPVDVRKLGVDLLSLSGHKIRGPKGIGALYIKAGTNVRPLIYGGHHEGSRRAGTENVPAIVGLGKACELARQELPRFEQQVGSLRDRLEAEIVARVPDSHVNGHPERRLPSTTNIAFSGLDGESLLMNLDLLGIAVSTGSACTSGAMEPSHVLTAMGRSAEMARASIRFSLGMETTQDEIDRTLRALEKAVGAMRRGSLLCVDAESESG